MYRHRKIYINYASIYSFYILKQGDYLKMNLKILALTILLVAIIIIYFSPFYRNYQQSLLKKLGFWNVLFPLGIIIFSNLLGILLDGIYMVFFLIPLDIVFLCSAIYIFIKVKRERNK